MLVVAEAAWQLTRIYAESAIIADTHAVPSWVRRLAISSIVIALAMRYLYVSSEWRRSIVLEAQARISALQALIRPHFLFNSMNTIASLTRTNPQLAEEAVEDLSDLLRANLDTSGERSSLKQELETARIYQRIEDLRLGDRLSGALGCGGPADARKNPEPDHSAAARECDLPRHRAAPRWR